MPNVDGKRLREKVLDGAEKVEEDEMGQNEWEVVCAKLCLIVPSPTLTTCIQVMLIDPSQFRVINELLQKECKGKGRIETMTFTATAS
jgi:ribosome maturation protein SDO1